jgi:hypothetical protein
LERASGRYIGLRGEYLSKVTFGNLRADYFSLAAIALQNPRGVRKSFAAFDFEFIVVPFVLGAVLFFFRICINATNLICLLGLDKAVPN